MRKSKPESVESQGEESQGQQERKRARDGRARQYAFVVYPDSAPDDWIQRLDDLHIEALISPLHDRDVNPDGKSKKSHWHCMLLFDGKKSLAQINEIREKVLGPDYNRALEDIGSLRGYARYLCHLDNPEKFQYPRSGVTALGGADFDATIALPGDDVKMMGDILEYINSSDIFYFDQLLSVFKVSNPDWFSFLIQRRSYVVVQILKAKAKRARVGEPLSTNFNHGIVK